MERSTKKSALINFIVLALVGVAGFIVARYVNSMAGLFSVFFIAIGVLVAAISWFQMRLEERERLEKLELDELARTHAASALFEAKDAEAFPAQRSREQFERYFVPAFTILLCILEGVVAYISWRWLERNGPGMVLRQPTVGMALFALFALILFLLGKFSATIARIEQQPLLRPSAGFLLLGGYLCFVTALGIAGVQAEFPKCDLIIARIQCALLALVSLETLVVLVLEVYRPRLKGKIERPLYESRVVGVLGQPESLISTATQTLDYQFGFKVSETGFYLFLRSWLPWLLLGQLAVLVLSTSVVFVEAGEQALLERFGRPVEGRNVLGPGGHLKWPWPVDRIYRFRTEQVQNFNVGFTVDPARENDPVVLWSVPHTKEENFLVANRAKAASDESGTAGTRRAPPVSLITVSIPVQFQITNLLDWAYNNEDAPALLEDLATREIVRYLAAADMNEVMSQGRLEAAQVVQDRLQARAIEHKVGARISFVGLEDIHPPVKVAPDYEKVISAKHTKQATILAAQADDIRTNALARATATNLINKAVSESLARTVGAAAQAALFTNQIPAFNAAPSVYANRLYLQALTRGSAQARKYVILTSNPHDVLNLDLQDQIRPDILGSLTVPSTRK